MSASQVNMSSTLCYKAISHYVCPSTIALVTSELSRSVQTHALTYEAIHHEDLFCTTILEEHRVQNQVAAGSAMFTFYVAAPTL